MYNFDELTLKQKSQITAEQLPAYEDFHLMTEGVQTLMLAPPAPPVKPVIATTKFYQVKFGRYDSSCAVFKDADTAAAFIALRPLKLESDYSTGFSYVESGESPKIEELVVASKAAHDAILVELKEYKRLSDIYEKEKSDFEKWQTKKSQILSGIRNEWHQAKSHARDMERVASTFAEYVKVADGDVTMAMKFLTGKAFSEATVNEATEWFGGDLGSAGG